MCLVFQVPVQGPRVASSVFFLPPGREAAETLCGGKFCETTKKDDDMFKVSITNSSLFIVIVINTIYSF